MSRRSELRDVQLAIGALASLVEQVARTAPIEDRELFNRRLQIILSLTNCETVAAANDGSQLRRPIPTQEEIDDAVARAAGVVGDQMLTGVRTATERGDRSHRYWIDLVSGDGYGTDDLEDVRKCIESGSCLNARDRLVGVQLVYQKKVEHSPENPLSPIYETRDTAAIGSRSRGRL
jgi:hypothetical protein